MKTGNKMILFNVILLLVFVAFIAYLVPELSRAYGLQNSSIPLLATIVVLFSGINVGIQYLNHCWRPPQDRQPFPWTRVLAQPLVLIVLAVFIEATQNWRIAGRYSPVV